MQVVRIDFPCLPRYIVLPTRHEREGIRIHPYPVFAGWILQLPRPCITMSSTSKPGAHPKAAVAAAEDVTSSNFEGDQPPQPHALSQVKQTPATSEVSQKGFEPNQP